MAKNSNRQIGERPKKQITLKIDQNIWEMVEDAAKEQGKSKIFFVEDALLEYFYHLA